MAKEDETPRTNPAEIENLIEQIRGTNLEPGVARQASSRVLSLSRSAGTVESMREPPKMK
jgi:hypothetical protein